MTGGAACFLEPELLMPWDMTVLRRVWEKEQFEPGAAGVLLNPFFFARRGLRRELGGFLAGLRGEVLDVGCGRKPYQHLVPATRYVGVDIDSPVTRKLATADVFYNGRTLPFAEGSFDAVLCSQVLEHVFKPEEFLSEIHRVLRPGGVLLLATPFAWDEHEQPYDFARYSSFGLRDLIERAGFQVEAQRKTCADFRAIVQLASGALYKITRSRHRWLNGLAQVALIAPVNAMGGLIALALPRNPDFYLDNIVLARRPAAVP
jgi:SAM-dependent methyltransferase